MVHCTLLTHRAEVLLKPVGSSDKWSPGNMQSQINLEIPSNAAGREENHYSGEMTAGPQKNSSKNDDKRNVSIYVTLAMLVLTTITLLEEDNGLNSKYKG